MLAYKIENEDAIRARAHSYWEAEGKPEGRDKIHWQRALESFSIPEIMPLATVSEISDVSLIDGVGPKITAQLAKAGITSLQQIARMNAEQLADLDKSLNLKGRSAREDWVKQAQGLIAGAAPRAKIDQKKAAKA